MAVTKTTSTNSKYLAWHSDNTTLATAISDVINALDSEGIPLNLVRISQSSYYDSSNVHFVVIAIAKKH